MTSSTSFIAFLPLVLSLLVLFSSVAPSVPSPTEKITHESLKRICTATPYPRRCFRTLRHDPQIKTLPLSNLTLFYIEKAREKASSTIFQLGELSRKTNDTDLKSRYGGCIYEYKLALADLNRAKRRLSSGDISGISGLAMKSVTGPSECDDQFEDGKYGTSSVVISSKMELASLGGIVFSLAAELIIA